MNVVEAFALAARAPLAASRPAAAATTVVMTAADRLVGFMGIRLLPFGNPAVTSTSGAAKRAWTAARCRAN
jgi:hypothetical protein